jgi:hypothetical protein
MANLFSPTWVVKRILTNLNRWTNVPYLRSLKKKEKGVSHV